MIQLAQEIAAAPTQWADVAMQALSMLAPLVGALALYFRARAKTAEQAAEDLSDAVAEAGPAAQPVIERLAELPEGRKAELKKTQARAVEKSTTRLKKDQAP